MGGASNQIMDVYKMNANIDRALVKAVKKIKEQLLKHPEGLFIYEITSFTNLNTDVAKQALAMLGCKENSTGQWELPDEAHVEVVPSTPKYLQFAEYYSGKYDMSIEMVLKLLGPDAPRGTLQHCHEAWEAGQQAIDLDDLKLQLADAHALNIQQHDQIIKLVAGQGAVHFDEWQDIYKETEIAAMTEIDAPAEYRERE